MKMGRWRKVPGGGFTTAGGDPAFECGGCGNSVHVFGAEHRKRKTICDVCGRVNIYPWEQSFEQTSSLWEEDEERPA